MKRYEQLWCAKDISNKNRQLNKIRSMVTHLDMWIGRRKKRQTCKQSKDTESMLLKQSTITNNKKGEDRGKLCSKCQMYVST